MTMDQGQVEAAIKNLVELVLEYEKDFDCHFRIAGIPNGGIPVAIQLAAQLDRPYSVVGSVGFHDDPEITLIVDDLVDSGNTINPWMDKGFVCAVIGIKPSYTLNNIGDCRILYTHDFPDEWIHFWWEPENITEDPQRHVTRILQYLGEDPNRNGLLETPSRVVRSWQHIYGGYQIDPKSVFKEFDEPVQDDLIIMRNISFSSTCEHHMLPFIGKAHIAYIPKGNKVIGASKMIRLLEIYAHRLQIQERIAQQVCDALEKHLDCYGCACIIEAVHSCILCRGVGNSTAELVTPVLRGDLRKSENSALRAELYANISRP